MASPRVGSGLVRLGVGATRLLPAFVLELELEQPPSSVATWMAALAAKHSSFVGSSFSDTPHLRFRGRGSLAVLA